MEKFPTVAVVLAERVSESFDDTGLAVAPGPLIQLKSRHRTVSGIGANISACTGA
jgi:hypothetical protein